MNRIYTLLILFCFTILANAQFAKAPAFPGAEGFGRYTNGGRGGVVYHVTTLDDYYSQSDYSPTGKKDKPVKGTLRYAVEKKGARIVVFDVAGTITLKCPLKIENDSITILGQTAPGDGICLRNHTVSVNASNVIIRFMRFRMGDEGLRYYHSGKPLEGKEMRIEDDAMNSAHKSNAECHDIIIDHCSLSWSSDECGSFYANQDFTLQWCVLAESLRNSVHVKGNHGYAGIWGGKSASFHHNLIAHHDSRAPRFDHGYLSTFSGPIDYINNVVYNWGNNSTYGGENKAGCEPKQINFIGNYYKAGPYTINEIKDRAERMLNPTTTCSNCEKQDPASVVPAQFFFDDNIINGHAATIENNVTYDKNYDINKFLENCILKNRVLSLDYDYAKYNTLSKHDANKAFCKVVEYAGASLSRDIIDTEVCDDVNNGTAKYKGCRTGASGLIDTPDDVKGDRESAWPNLTGNALVDTDEDGIPDSWEIANKLNPNDATDGLKYTLDKKGYYSNLEVYANSIVEDIVKSQRSDAKESFKEYYPKSKK